MTKLTDKNLNNQKIANQNSTNRKLSLVIVMGVSGTGKSTIAKTVAEQLGFEFIEADDFHSEQAKQLMANNVPLTEALRAPWIARLCEQLATCHQQGKQMVMAYSGLKSKHRDCFRALDYHCQYYYLQAEQSTVATRITQRRGHFFNADLLASQYAAMEAPKQHETDITSIDATKSIVAICDHIAFLTIPNNVGVL